MFTIKEVADSLQMSTQAIYKQSSVLKEKGYMTKNSIGKWEINENGFNYLRDKKIENVKQVANQKLQPVANQLQENEQPEAEQNSAELEYTGNDRVATILINYYKKQLQTVANQLQEMEKEKDYFKAKFEEKDSLCNQYFNTHLLPPTEEEKTNQERSEKKSFFKRLFQ